MTVDKTGSGYTDDSGGTDSQQDKVLIRALYRLFEYDQAARIAKVQFYRGRMLVLFVVTAGTVAALSTSLISRFESLTLVLGFSAIVLPILGSYLISDIQNNRKSISWLKFRLIAERIRSQIYLYVMAAGDYADAEVNKRDNILNEEIHAPEIFTGTQANLSFEDEGSTQVPESEITSIAAQSTVDTDTGDQANTKAEVSLLNRPKQVDQAEFFKDLFMRDNLLAACIRSRKDQRYYENVEIMEAYLDTRARRQQGWYDWAIRNYGRKLRYLTMIASAILFAGAIFPPLVFLTDSRAELIAIASVTNILSFSVVTWSTVATFGRPVGLFRVARDKLNKQLGDWEAAHDDEDFTVAEKRVAFQVQLINDIEHTLAWEREKWYESSFQSLPAVDEAYFKAVEEINSKNKYKKGVYDSLPDDTPTFAEVNEDADPPPDDVDNPGEEPE